MPRRLDLSVEYVQCRTWGHAWEDFIPDGKREPGWGHRFSLRCVRCATERHDTIDSLGRLSVRTYEYPEDYSLSEWDVADRPDRAALRLDLLKKMHGRAGEFRGNGNG
jgi:hypothetical protein